MSRLKLSFSERDEQILATAAELIIRYGYDKVTMSDIASQAGVTRAIIYQHYKSKEQLFEALLFQETGRYTQAWLEALESDEQGGTIASVFRSVLIAVNSSPFLSALLQQDQRVFGQYLRKPGNLFQSMQSSTVWVETLQALQAVGAVRQDIPTAEMAHVMNALAIGLLVYQDQCRPGEVPQLDRILEVVALMVDRTLAPAGEADLHTGKQILVDLARRARAQFEHAGKTLAERWTP
jgi:AcrR family transcriptional regulator